VYSSDEPPQLGTASSSRIFFSLAIFCGISPWPSFTTLDARAAAARAATLTDLQSLLDAFTVIYNTRRPHKSLPHQATPATAYTARPKALPGDRTADARWRVRTGRTDPAGKLTRRVNGKLHDIGTGTDTARVPVLMLVPDLNVAIINAATGELIRELTVDPGRDYQPLGRPPGPQPKQPRTR